MNILVTWKDTDLVLDAAQDATVADLRSALSDTPEKLWIDGWRAADELSISEIPNGAVLGASGSSEAERPRRSFQSGMVTFNRPPRVGAPDAPAPPRPPEQTAIPDRRVRFAWATVVVSTLAGTVLAVVFGPVFALFSLLGPLMATGTWIEGRMALRRERREARLGHAREMGRYRANRLRWERNRLAHRRLQMPGPDEVVERAVRMASSLWERRPDHADFGLVSIGLAPGGDPVGVVLASGVTVGVAGDREAAMGIVRWVLVQAAVHHGPADMSLQGPSEPSWDWLKWFPHAGRTGGLEIRVTDGGDRPVLDAVNVVIAETVLELPGDCDFVIEARADGEGTFLRVGDGVRRRVRATLQFETDALVAARALARVQDPEDPGARMGGQPVRLQELLGFPTSRSIIRRWREDRELRAPIGLGPEGLLEVDLVADGPHGLLAGTTGSGKSELLRTLVLSFAATFPPSRIVFVLIDYKGGSTFDSCAGLPHVVGSLTDLDETSAHRALEALEAEVRDREERLRAHGAEDLGAYRGNPPIPHLLVIIDEFATLAEQAPEALDGLVDIARRGRSLGMHLLLATQRPAGVISSRIRANTALRIALRVHDPADSEDVIGAPGAARISRHTPGRGFLRLGPGELVQFQSALATTYAGDAKVRTAPFRVGEPIRWQCAPAEASDLANLVHAIEAAAIESEEPTPPAVWAPELPERVVMSELGETPRPDTPWAAPFGLIDDVRSRRVLWWEATNVLFVGPPGSGSTKALAALATAVCLRHPETHVHAVGVEDGELRGLERMPQVGNIVSSGESERTDRLLRYLIEEVEHRRRSRLIGPPILLLAEGAPSGDPFRHVVGDGPAAGVFTGISVRHVGAISGSLLAAFPERFAFRLMDPYEYAALGLERVTPPATGAALRVASGRLVRIAEPAVSTGIVPVDLPVAIDALPGGISLSEFESAARIENGVWFIPIGQGGKTLLHPVGFRLEQGRHIVITGGRGAGKTTALRAVATSARGKLAVTIVGNLNQVGGERTDDLLAFLADPGSLPRLCLIDDADRIQMDPSHVPPGVHLVVAAKADHLAYGHWLRRIIGDAEGLALRPDHRDEDLWRVRLAPSMVPGRGMLIARGDLIPIQVASGTMAAPLKEDTDNARSNRNRRHAS
ncbi:MAG: AAA family ATPase [Gammaproteobacteria bacterium]|nr:AAA family ATPase [Gammaproteobacteria bacterium]